MDFRKAGQYNPLTAVLKAGGGILMRMLMPALIAMVVMGSATAGVAGDVADCKHTVSANACRRLADQGEAWAQHNLGWMYEHGHGVPQDYKEAVKWYRRAADQGLANSQYNLGVMYTTGHGVPQDDKEAVKWYRKAANQNLADGHYNLGWMYLRGQGVPQDYVRAYTCFELAAKGFPPGRYRQDAVESRDLAAKKLTPTQIEEAQRRAREWGPESDEL